MNTRGAVQWIEAIANSSDIDGEATGMRHLFENTAVLDFLQESLKCLFGCGHWSLGVAYLVWRNHGRFVDQRNEDAQYICCRRDGAHPTPVLYFRC